MEGLIFRILRYSTLKKKQQINYVFFWEMDFVKGPVDEFVTSCRFLSGIASSHLTLIPSHP